jgi:hypothetical protein
MPRVERIIAHLHTRDHRYHGFALTRCSDGATIRAQISGGESNVRFGLTFDGHDWLRDYYWYEKQVRENELFVLPYAGSGEDIRDWVKAEFAKCGDCACGWKATPLDEHGQCVDCRSSKKK